MLCKWSVLVDNVLGLLGRLEDRKLINRQSESDHDLILFAEGSN